MCQGCVSVIEKPKKTRITKITDENCFAKNYPELLEEWNWENNKEVDPWKTTNANPVKVSWICKICKHEWIRAISDRTVSKSGCPECYKQRNKDGSHKLQENFIDIKFPELLKDWDHEENNKSGITYRTHSAFSNHKVHWKCADCGNKWEGRLIHRTKYSRGCKECKKKNRRDSQFIKCNTCGYEYNYRDQNRAKDASYCPNCWEIEKESRLLKSVKPELFKEIHPTRNKNLGEVFSKSNQNIWWLCSKCGNEWEATVLNRFNNSHNCESCKNKEKCFDNKYPDLIDYWDSEKNNIFDLNNFIPIKTDRYYWECPECGHGWKQSLLTLLQKEEELCPKCISLNKEYEGIYNITINGNNILLPEICKMTGLSKHAIRYRIKQGYSPEQVIDLNYRKLNTETPFHIKCPQLLEEWDYEKNDLLNIKPEKCGYRSKKEVWWKCKSCDHNWISSISKRSMASEDKNCPNCYSFGNMFPELLKDWDYNKNTTSPYKLRPHSAIIVWWKCAHCAFEWETPIASRSFNHSQCLNCCGSGSSIIERKLYFFFKLIFGNTVKHRHKINCFNEKNVEVDIFIESLKICIEYDGSFWHKDKIESDKNKNEALNNSGFRIIRIRENDLSLLSIVDDISHKSNGSLKELLREILKRIEKHYSLFNYWVKIGEIMSMDIENYIIPKEYMIYPFVEDSLLTRYPEIAKEWNYELNGGLTPDLVKYDSYKQIYWTCTDCNNIYKTSVSTKIKTGFKCLECYLFENNITKTHPEISTEWDYDLNEGLIPESFLISSNKLIWWKCSKCGFSWQEIISKRRFLKNGCKQLCGIKRENILSIKFPKLAAEWMVEKNNNITPDIITYGSCKYAWWKCSCCEHEWRSRVDSRTLLKSRCPECRNKVLV